MTLKKTENLNDSSLSISVLVCTYRRPKGLRRLLVSLSALKDSTPSFEVVIVDNDPAESARKVAEDREFCQLRVNYKVETIQNISRARNRSVQAARGRYVAFIDDDEWAEPDWLAALFATAEQYKADAVMGPVQIHVPPETPRWFSEAGYFDREVLTEGQTLDWWQTSTTNALVRRDILSSTNLFDESFGLSGGEDCELFSRIIRQGYRVIGAERGQSHESYPSDRATAGWLIRRHFRNGMIAQRIECQGNKALRFSKWSGYSLLHLFVWRKKGLSYLLKAIAVAGEVAASLGITYEPYRKSQPTPEQLS